MNSSGGYIRLHRKITGWEWYHDTNTFRIFLHILLNANFTDGRFEGKLIKRGQLVTSLPTLSRETGVTIRSVRTALEHLFSTGELTVNRQPRYSVITVVNYNLYQSDDSLTDRELTGNRQSTDSQLTVNRQQYKKEKREKEEKGKNNMSSSKTFIPPTVADVEAYCDQRGQFWIDPQSFIDYYEARGWMIGKQKMKDWKAAVRLWEKREKERRAEDDSDMPY